MDLHSSNLCCLRANCKYKIEFKKFLVTVKRNCLMQGLANFFFLKAIYSSLADRSIQTHFTDGKLGYSEKQSWLAAFIEASFLTGVQGIRESAGCLGAVGYIIMISTWKGVHRKDLTKFSHSLEVFLKHWDLRANEHNTKAQDHWSRLELGPLHFLQIPLIHTKVCMCLCVCVHACMHVTVTVCICTKANKG